MFPKTAADAYCPITAADQIVFVCVRLKPRSVAIVVPNSGKQKMLPAVKALATIKNATKAFDWRIAAHRELDMLGDGGE
jgi:hypothetical protein